MSFTFQWPRFSDQFHADAIQMLNNALNKGDKPPVIADKIEVVELEMGTQPPELEIRDIGDLTTDQFRGIFRLTYAGDAHLVLKTKVQANPLNHKQPDIHLMSGSRGMLAAREPLVVPMLLRLSHFKLNSYVVLVVSKQKGITLVFKTDPLQNVDINSTFDSIAVIQKFIQREIEGQLRQMFREDLPGIIHRLSQQWVKAKVEAPYLDKRPPAVVHRPFDAASAPDLSHVSDGLFGPGLVALQQSFARTPSLGTLSYGRVRSVSGVSVASSTRRTSQSIQPTPSVLVIPSPAEPTGSLPELENFDPTYGLRPDGLPTKSVFSGFGRLFKQNKGLADLTEEQSEVDEEEEREEEGEEEESRSYSEVDWENTSIDYSPPATLPPDDSPTEYETIPAIGGGTITRPRVYHSQSMIQPPTEISRTTTDAGSISASTPSLRHPVSPSQQAGPSRASSFPYGTPRIPLTHRPISSYNPYFPQTPAYSSSERQRTRSEPACDITPSRPRHGHRPVTPDSLDTHLSRSTSSGLVHSIETPPTTEPPHSAHSHESINKPPPPSFRRLSVSSPPAANLDPFHSGSPPPHHAMSEADPKIILRPTLNNTLHQLSTLSYSNHTLSPYTRSLEHFAVRSGPPRTLNAFGVRAPPERRPVKAKRKRTYRIGGNPQPQPNPEPKGHPPRTSAPSPVPSEFDPSEIDRYFRTGDDPGGLDGEPGPSGRGRQELHAPDSPRRAPPLGPLPRYPRDTYETLRRRRP
ncbi:hypothetical protein J3R83DRAFT_1245 [Lanmaoa asiatica]|nr:hypothetical protein J3R83DRAFT_1245 [Lanmaoa asiatica]